VREKAPTLAFAVLRPSLPTLASLAEEG
jgi:hypothetical protein